MSTRWFRALVPLLFAGGLAACGGPTQPTPTGPVAQCPANVQVDSTEGGAASVTYALAEATGGTPPYTVSCTPQSGSRFSVGVNTVSCAVVDSRGANGSCSFMVTVVSPPRLGVSRMVAFGDSLTLGEVSAPATVWFPVIDPVNNYPTQLQGLLTAYYRGQGFTVINSGIGGEAIGGPSVHSPGATVRLPRVLDTEHPEALLLMEGTNDLNGLEAGRAAAAGGLADMVEVAKARGVRVFLATIPPMRPPGTKNIKPAVAALVPVYNEDIRRIATIHDVPLVDVYSAMKDDPSLIGSDGLHATVRGYSVIAQAFFNALKSQLQAAQAADRSSQ